MNWRVEVGDCRDVLRQLPAESVHTVITSPPYFGLRDYGTGEWEGGDPACDHLGAPHRTQAGFNERYFGREKTEGWENKQGELREPYRDVCGKCGARRVDRQIGLEPTPDEFVAALVAVFREVRRVLRDDGTVWLNLGDSYASNPGSGYANGNLGGLSGAGSAKYQETLKQGHATFRAPARGAGVKQKDLLGIPWMVAFALRADGWYLRSDIIWSKLNPMPESVTDRPTKSHEYLFLLSKSAKYQYDADAIREPHAPGSVEHREKYPQRTYRGGNGSMTALQMQGDGVDCHPSGRNKRSVWTVATQPYAGAHFATFPPKLIEPCVLAGAPERACGVCGAPWVRVVERTRVPRSSSTTGNGYNAHSSALHGSRDSNFSTGADTSVRTLGFEPSCSHGDGSASGVVLDPFAGAGTTGLVALQHGRDFIGIELNPEYAGMARDRIGTAVRLGFRPPQRGPEVDADQASLFETNGTA